MPACHCRNVPWHSVLCFVRASSQALPPSPDPVPLIFPYTGRRNTPTLPCCLSPPWLVTCTTRCLVRRAGRTWRQRASVGHLMFVSGPRPAGSLSPPFPSCIAALYSDRRAEPRLCRMSDSSMWCRVDTLPRRNSLAPPSSVESPHRQRRITSILVDSLVCYCYQSYLGVSIILVLYFNWACRLWSTQWDPQESKVTVRQL